MLREGGREGGREKGKEGGQWVVEDEVESTIACRKCFLIVWTPPSPDTPLTPFLSLPLRVLCSRC
jgi:hypothetical protein